MEAIANFIGSLFKESGRRPKPTKEVLAELERARKTPAPPPPPIAIKPLKIRSEQDWNEYQKKLNELDKLNQFVAKNVDDPNWKWFSKSLEKVKKDILKITPNEFNEYTTEQIVSATVDMSKKFIAALDSCGRTIKNPMKDSSSARELSDLIEKYLLGLGIRPMNFKPGDDYEKWADLGMSSTPFTEKTSDSRKHNTLKEIFIQPHFLSYINEHDNETRRVFGGQCAVYVFQG